MFTLSKKYPSDICNIIEKYIIELNMSEKSKKLSNIHSELKYGYYIENYNGKKYIITNQQMILFVNNKQIENLKSNSQNYSPFLTMPTDIDETNWIYPFYFEYYFATRIPKLEPV